MAQRALSASSGMIGGIAWDIRAELVLARLELSKVRANLALGHVSAAAARLAQRELPHVTLAVDIDLLRGQALTGVSLRRGRT